MRSSPNFTKLRFSFPGSSLINGLIYKVNGEYYANYKDHSYPVAMLIMMKRQNTTGKRIYYKDGNLSNYHINNIELVTFEEYNNRIKAKQQQEDLLRILQGGF